MLTGITFDLVLNRGYNKETDYISPNGCRMKLTNGDIICFNFWRTCGKNLKPGDHFIHIEQDDLDYDPKLNHGLSEESLDTELFKTPDTKGILNKLEIYISLGDGNDSPELEILGIRNFEAYFTKRTKESGFLDEIVEIPSELILVTTDYNVL